jgi:hypothetical protein
MTAIETCRNSAAQQPAAAFVTNLPNRRPVHNRCVKTSVAMARSVKATLERVAVYLAVRLSAPQCPGRLAASASEETSSRNGRLSPILQLP